MRVRRCISMFHSSRCMPLPRREKTPLRMQGWLDRRKLPNMHQKINKVRSTFHDPCGLKTGHSGCRGVDIMFMCRVHDKLLLYHPKSRSLFYMTSQLVRNSDHSLHILRKLFTNCPLVAPLRIWKTVILLEKTNGLVAVTGLVMSRIQHGAHIRWSRDVMT